MRLKESDSVRGKTSCVRAVGWRVLAAYVGAPTGIVALLLWLLPTMTQAQACNPYPETAYQVGPLETLLSASQRQGLGLSTWPDLPLGVVREADGTYTFYAPDGARGSGGATIIRTHGTLDNPTAFGLEIAPVTDFATTCNYYGGGQVFEDPDTRMLLMFTHCEHWMNDNPRRFVGTVALATSWDHGETWQDVGEIIASYYGMDLLTSPQIEGVVHPNIGTGGAAIIREGYFYVYYTDRVTIVPHDAISVARSTVADVFAAARQGYAPLFWKYYNGDWTEPGLRGLASELNDPSTNGIGAFSVAYNTVRQRLVLIGTDWGRPNPIYVYESIAGLWWERVQQIPNDHAEAVYMSIIGSGDPPQEVGDTFDVYFDSSPVVGRWADTTLARRALLSLPVR